MSRWTGLLLAAALGGCASDRFDAGAAASDPRLFLVPGVEPVRQAAEAWCGPACLEAVLGYYGREAPQAEIAARAGTTREGTPVEALKDAAQACGFEAFFLKGRPDATGVEGLFHHLERGRPVIVGLLKRGSFPFGGVFSHFVVVVGRWPAAGRWVVADPATGTLRAPREPEILAQWEPLGRVMIVVMPRAPGAPAPDPPRSPPGP